MRSGIKVGQRFKFNVFADPSHGRQAVVTQVLSNNEKGLSPEVNRYIAYWVQAHELPLREPPNELFLFRGTDGNTYLEGRLVSITLLS